MNFLRGYAFRVHDGRDGLVYAEKGCYSYFLEMEPVDMAGYSIYIYHVEPPVKMHTSKARGP